MKKIKIALFLLICAFVTLTASALCSAEDKEYIVYLNRDVSLFTAENKDYYILSEEELSEALALGIVEFYEEDYEVFLHDEEITLMEAEEAPVLDPKQDQYKWDMALINAYYPREKGFFGEGITIAVIDSGCNSHLEMPNNILTGFNIIDESNDVTDNIGHGTKVSGVIAAEINEIGISGVAPKCKILPIKAFDTDFSTKTSHIAEAIMKVADDYDCDIINLSLGSAKENETLKAAIDYAIEKGIIIIASSGNDGTTAYNYPASYDNVVSVGAIDINKEICDYSQYNDKINVVAPGGTAEKPVITVSWKNEDKYMTAQGTSFAAPQVSGIAALLKCADASLTQADFLEIIERVSVDLGEKGFDNYYGYGMADAEAYLDYHLAETADSDDDGALSQNDALLIVNEVANKKNASSITNRTSADVDRDGAVTMKDAFLIIRHIKKWTEDEK